LLAQQDIEKILTAQPPLVICLMGPTASGKTELAIQISKCLPCEIISVDSALIYKDMNIGTAKPEPAVLADAPHKLIDFLDPAESYSAAQFRTDALVEINAAIAKGKVPLLVGGTMMYFKALLYGLADMPKANPQVRAEIELEAAEKGWDVMHQQLAAVDPAAAHRLKPSDRQRLQRALEVYRISGKTMTELHQQQHSQNKASNSQLAEDCNFSPLLLAISPQDRGVLHQRIEQRFDQMIDNEFIAEVQALCQRGDLNEAMPAVRAVGYRQMWDYLQGKLSLVEARERAVIATRQLAKRQLTWLRGWPEVIHLHTNATNQKVLSPAQVAGKSLLAAALHYLMSSA
jgi:tRNA dimethylallyltransferase